MPEETNTNITVFAVLMLVDTVQPRIDTVYARLERLLTAGRALAVVSISGQIDEEHHQVAEPTVVVRIPFSLRERISKQTDAVKRKHSIAASNDVQGIDFTIRNRNLAVRRKEIAHGDGRFVDIGGRVVAGIYRVAMLVVLSTEQNVL
jgi:hypothetical protein